MAEEPNEVHENEPDDTGAPIKAKTKGKKKAKKPHAEEEGHGKSWRAPRKHASYTPNMTPLIDVLFLLLLFFLLSSKYRQAEGAIPGSLPKIGGGVSTGTDVINVKFVIQVIPEGDNLDTARYKLQGMTDATDARSLFDKLHQKVTQSGGEKGCEKIQVVIRPRRNAPWQFVVEAFNQAMRAKFKNIGFAPAD